MLSTAHTGAHAAGLADQVRGYLTVTSDYRQHGLSQSRGEPAVQVGADFEHPTGWFAGAWIGTIEYVTGGRTEGSTEAKLGWYAGFGRRIDRWSLATTVARYAYPGTTFDYDYSEVSGSVGYRDRIFFTASYSDDLFARVGAATNLELGGALPLPFGLEVGATIGRFEARRADARFTHWNAGVSKTVADRLGIDVRYYDGGGDFSTPVAASSEDRWVLSASYGFGAR